MAWNVFKRTKKNLKWPQELENWRCLTLCTLYFSIGKNSKRILMHLFPIVSTLDYLTKNFKNFIIYLDFRAKNIKITLLTFMIPFKLIKVHLNFRAKIFTNLHLQLKRFFGGKIQTFKVIEIIQKIFCRDILNWDILL